MTTKQQLYRGATDRYASPDGQSLRHCYQELRYASATENLHRDELGLLPPPCIGFSTFTGLVASLDPVALPASRHGPEAARRVSGAREVRS